MDNHSGVLTRVASLFGRRGFNIVSLTAVSYTHLDVYKRQVLPGPEHHLARARRVAGGEGQRLCGAHTVVVEPSALNEHGNLSLIHI